jgi:MbtH protein
MSQLEDSQESRIFIVLINEEEQYSLWPKGKKIPNGWTAVGPEGTQEECSKYVDEVWTDMRPLSLRKKMDQDRASS